MTSSEWPLGPLLERARITAGLTKRQAAKRAQISEGGWRRLEAGYYMVQGQRIPLVAADSDRRGTTAETVVRVAKAVNLDINTALEAAGFPRLDGDDSAPPPRRDEAYDELVALWKVFSRAWGPDIADKAIDRLYRDRDAAPNDASESDAG
ncbi:hypothetical protein SUDANB95_05472 [Actinosynnema sp. ALI-1.44]